MREMMMAIALLVSGVLFNPPPVLEEMASSLFRPADAQAQDVQSGEESEEGSDAERTPLLTGNIPHFSIIINVPALELRLFEDADLVKRFPIAVGQARFPTPTGKVDSLSHIIWNPWWYPPDSGWAKDDVITPPGPNNPLGVVKMPLSNAILLHGTNKESSIGTPASHACIRMYNEDAKTLAWTLQSNLTPHFDESLLAGYEESRRTVWINLTRSVPVQFVYEPVEINGDELSIYQDLYRRIRNIRGILVDKLQQKGISEEDIDGERLEEIIQEWRNGEQKVTVLLSELLKSG